ncbi:(-)-germacrene D synthase [Linum perenne]
MTSASASVSASAKSAPERRKAQYYHPCVWGDFFLTHVFDTNDERMLLADDEENKSFDHLNSIERLGIGYHFEPEIKRIVQQQVDRDASFMRTHGETILDEAMVFTETHLKSAEFGDPAGSALAERVAHALKRPLRKEIEKLQHLFFIRNYEKIQGHNQSLLKLAKWWIELDFSSKVLYARHKLVETYYWSLGLLWEPKYSLARYIVTKQTTIGTVLDDTYDNYGTFEELELFTSKCARWDTYTDDLYMSMKYVYEAVMDLNEEIGVITSKEGRPYCLEYAKRAREQERGYGPSSVQIYMKQFRVTKEEAIDALYGYIDDDWRTINGEMMMLMNRPSTNADQGTVIPNEFLAVFLGNAQIMETLYRDTDSYTFSDTFTKDILTTLLVTPMPI